MFLLIDKSPDFLELLLICLILLLLQVLLSSYYTSLKKEQIKISEKVMCLRWNFTTSNVRTVSNYRLFLIMVHEEDIQLNHVQLQTLLTKLFVYYFSHHTASVSCIAKLHVTKYSKCYAWMVLFQILKVHSFTLELWSRILCIPVQIFMTLRISLKNQDEWES